MNPTLTPTNGHVVVELTDADRRYLKRVRLGGGHVDEEGVANHQMCIMQAVTALTTPGLDIPALVREKARLERALGKFRVNTPYTVYSDLPEEDRKKYDELDGRLGKIEQLLTLSDAPICVSEQITAAMQHLNDRLSPRERGKLKGLVDTILNTCPIKTKTYKTKPAEEVRDKNAEYRAAEKERLELLDEVFHGKKETVTGPRSSRTIRTRRLTLKESMELIKQAADLYHVEAPNAPGS